MLVAVRTNTLKTTEWIALMALGAFAPSSAHAGLLASAARDLSAATDAPPFASGPGDFAPAVVATAAHEIAAPSVWSE